MKVLKEYAAACIWGWFFLKGSSYCDTCIKNQVIDLIYRSRHWKQTVCRDHSKEKERCWACCASKVFKVDNEKYVQLHVHVDALCTKVLKSLGKPYTFWNWKNIAIYCFDYNPCRISLGHLMLKTYSPCSWRPSLPMLKFAALRSLNVKPKLRRKRDPHVSQQMWRVL